MTTLTSNYNYMDLLKQHNYVPQTIESSTDFLSELTDLVTRTLGSVKVASSGYDFMSLVKDKTDYAGATLIASNDNEALLQRA